MERGNEFFVLDCECGVGYTPIDSDKCPVCDERKVKDIYLNVDGFLERVYLRVSEDKDDVALDIVFGVFWNLWDKFQIHNEILTKADVNRLSEVLMVGLMTQTFKYIKQVPAHLDFCDRSAKRMAELGMDEKRIHDLVDRYRETGDYWKNMKVLGATGIMWGPRPPESE